MKKLLLLFTLVLIFAILCSCESKPLYDVNYPKPVIVEPDEDTAYNINGYKDTTFSAPITSQIQDTTEHTPSTVYQGKYIGNINSKKFHKSDCTYVKNMKEENAVIFESYNAAINNGYKRCTKCLNE